MTRADEVLIAVHRGSGEDAEYLVLLRAPYKKGYWHLAGGGVEPGESAYEAAVRELAEETAFVAPALDDLGDDLGYLDVRLHVFAVEAAPGWEPTLNDEHDDHRWCSLSAALALLAYEEPREVVRRAARRLGEER